MKAKTAILLIFLLILSSVITAPGVVYAGNAEARLDGIQGEVSIQRGGGLQALKGFDGMPLYQGDWIRTGENSSAKIVYESGTEAMIGANSLLSVQKLQAPGSIEPSSNMSVSGGKAGSQISFKLWAGSIWNKVKNLLNVDDQYEVETPTAIMGVRGTLYLVRIDENQQVTVDVMEGSVAANSNRERTDSGQEFLVTMGEEYQDKQAQGSEQAINLEQLIDSVQPSMLVEVVNDVSGRVDEFVANAEVAKKNYDYTKNEGEIKKALVLIRKAKQLSEFTQKYVDTLANSNKAQAVDDILKDKGQDLQKLKTNLEQVNENASKTEEEVIEKAQDAGLSEEEVEDIAEEALEVSTPVVEDLTPPPSSHNDYSPPPIIDTVPPTVTPSPAEGTYITGQTVSLALSEAGAVYYTVDGAEPTVSSTKYSTPIIINQTTVLKFIAVDQAGNQSAVYTQTYTINSGASIIPVNTTTTFASISSAGIQADDWSDEIAISSDGNAIAFQSAATNLVQGDTNGASDIFVYDRDTGETERVNVNSDGIEANSGASWPDISSNGRYVAFHSYSTSLDGSGRTGVFVRDRVSGLTTWIDNASSSPVSISGDGNRIVYSNSGLYLYDRSTSLKTYIGSGSNPSISSNGRYVVFERNVPGYQILVYDVDTEATTRMDVSSSGVPADGSSFYPDISGDGRFVSFESFAGNLTEDTGIYGQDVYVHDRDSDGNGVFDESGGIKTELVSVSTTGTPGNGSSGNTNGWGSVISDDGRFVAFESNADNLVCGDTNDIEDIFVRDLAEGRTSRVSVSSNGEQAAQCCATTTWFPVISGDVSIDGSGDDHVIAFVSSAGNLVAGDSNDTSDVFTVEFSYGASVADIAPPILVMSDPVDGENLYDLGAVDLKFNELILEGDAFSNISIWKNYGSPDQTEISFTPSINDCSLLLDAGFSYPYTYTVIVPAGAVKDRAGNLSNSEYTITFILISGGY